MKAVGMLGPATWLKMEPRLKAPQAGAAPSYPQVDWFKLYPKRAPTRGKLLVSEET